MSTLFEQKKEFEKLIDSMVFESDIKNCDQQYHVFFAIRILLLNETHLNEIENLFDNLLSKILINNGQQKVVRKLDYLRIGEYKILQLKRSDFLIFNNLEEIQKLLKNWTRIFDEIKIRISEKINQIFNKTIPQNSDNSNLIKNNKNENNNSIQCLTNSLKRKQMDTNSKDKKTIELNLKQNKNEYGLTEFEIEKLETEWIDFLVNLKDQPKNRLDICGNIFQKKERWCYEAMFTSKLFETEDEMNQIKNKVLKNYFDYKRIYPGNQAKILISRLKDGWKFIFQFSKTFQSKEIAENSKHFIDEIILNFLK